VAASFQLASRHQTGRQAGIDNCQREYKWKQERVAELVDDLAAKFLDSHEEGNDRIATVGVR
jgi:uncharacterized protein with ParB-like and HNH nuclease domain